jgi:hypothetical protein
MSWNKIKLKDLEKVFNQIFNPESLYGLQAVIYDEAISKSNHFGTTWKEEMENVNEYVYFDFIVSVLEEEGITSDDFTEK